MKWTLKISGSPAVPQLVHEFERGSLYQAEVYCERLIPLLANQHVWRFELYDAQDRFETSWGVEVKAKMLRVQL